MYYNSFHEFCGRIKTLKLENEWQISPAEDHVQICKYDQEHVVPIFEIYIDSQLTFTIRVFSWSLPNEHTIYNENSKSVKNITLSNLILILNNYTLCIGIINNLQMHSCIIHSIPKVFTPSLAEQSPLQQTTYYRASECQILTNDKQCSKCLRKQKQSESRVLKRKPETSVVAPAKLNAPISTTSSQRLKLTIQNYRLENKALKFQIEKLQNELSNSSLPVNVDLNNDLITIMKNTASSKITPFMKLFWEQQQKYLSSTETGIRYHPMIIRYCLGLASKSAAVYDDIRYDEKSGTGFLILPSRRRLSDYKNYIRPQRGFNLSIINELKDKVKQFSEIEKFVVLLFDEMKIQENLVWDKHTGELVGYVDLGDIELNYATLKKPEDIATHVLVFLIRSIL